MRDDPRETTPVCTKPGWHCLSQLKCAMPLVKRINFCTLTTEAELESDHNPRFAAQNEESPMIRKLAFDEVVDAIEGLSPDEQSELIHLIRCRLAERGRQQLIAEVGEARAEMAAGKARRLNLDELSREIEG